MAALGVAALLLAASAGAQCTLDPDGNRVLRVGTFNGILVRVSTEAGNGSPGLPPPITIAEASDVISKLPMAATNNSYGEWTLNMAKQPLAVTIKSPAFYDNYKQQPGQKTHTRGTMLVADVVQAAQSQQGTDLTSFDLIAIFLPPELKSGTVAVGRYALIKSYAGRSHAVLHEWGHAFGAGHANAYPFVSDFGVAKCSMVPCYATSCPSCTMMADSILGFTPSNPSFPSNPTFTICQPPPDQPQPGCTWGDTFDYMGLQSPARDALSVPRFKAGLTGFFADEEEIHVNPIRKLLQGWVDDLDIPVLNVSGPKPFICDIGPLSVDPAITNLPIAVEIPRRLITRAPNPGPCSRQNRTITDTESFLVYWRDNEPVLNMPGINQGASVALVSRATTGVATKTFVYEYDLLVKPPLDYEDTVLEPGQILDDAWVSQVRIQSLGVINDQFLRVAVDIPALLPDFSHVPLVNVRAAELEVNPSAILTGGYLTVVADAFDPALGCLSYDGVLRVEVALTIGEKPNVKCLASHVFYGSDTWQLWIGKAAGPNGEPAFRHPDTNDTLRAVCQLNATAFTTWTQGGVSLTNSASVRFQLDHDGPSAGL